MGLQDVLQQIAKQHGIDEVMVLYTSKLDVRDWVIVKSGWNKQISRPVLTAEKSRLLLKDWSQCALVVGSGEDFSDKLIAMEQVLHKKGFYKAWAVLNGPVESCDKRPCCEWFGIDMVGTLLRYKKNLQKPLPGTYPAWGLVLIE
jgi:hypothetical protein